MPRKFMPHGMPYCLKTIIFADGYKNIKYEHYGK